jgi:hypothetical protein
MAREPDISKNRVRLGTERIRAAAGVTAVLVGDAAIAIVAWVGIVHVSGTADASSEITGILTGAFVALSTTTTAYFGIKAATNTADRALGVIQGQDVPRTPQPPGPQ